MSKKTPLPENFDWDLAALPTRGDGLLKSLGRGILRGVSPWSNDLALLDHTQATDAEWRSWSPRKISAAAGVVALGLTSVLVLSNEQSVENTAAAVVGAEISALEAPFTGNPVRSIAMADMEEPDPFAPLFDALEGQENAIHPCAALPAGRLEHRAC
jgi:hypothetical protein